MNRYMIHPTSFLVRALTKLAGMPSGNAGTYNWSKLIKEEGLDVISLHTDLGSLENDYEGVIKDAKDFNTNYIVITGMYRFNYQNLNEVKKLAQRLNVVGERLRKDGFKLLYHNHNIELLKVDEINRAYDILVNETDACWCKHILRTHPEWIVKDLKTWGWIDETLLHNANEIHATELIDLIRRSPVLLIKHDGRFLDAFYSCMENKLHPALSYGKFIDSCTVLDFNEAIARTCTNRNAVNAEMFIQHFFTKDISNEKDSSNHN